MKLRFRTLSGGRTLGEIVIPTTPGRVTAAAAGDDRADALARCAAIAQRIATDPVMAIMMPPSVHDDLDELRMLAEAACHSPRALRETADELGITASGADASTRRKGRLKRNPKYRLATDLHATAKRRQSDDDGGDDDQGDDQGDDGYDDGADNGYPYQPPAPAYQPPAPSAPAQRPRIGPGRVALGDVVNGRNASIDGFWDDIQNVASQAGSAAWKLAKDHRKEIAMATATAAFGPAGGIAAGKAMDLINAAQQGHPEAQKAVAQVAAKSDAGDPKAKLMATVIKKEIVTQAKQAAAEPDHPANVPDPVNEPPAHDGPLDIERDHGEGTDAFGPEGSR